MLGYKVFYDKELKIFVHETEPSEVEATYNDETFWWTDNLPHAKQSAEKSNDKLNEIFICKDCGNSFRLDQQEQEWFIKRNLSIPCRCIKCRRSRKNSEKR